ncbi:MAG: tRNA (adenosine(37)-N6)-threonylcarbamoyltransferase complex ATPase subunit type 1 TsaE [Candidatus Eisenbacteria bacterium]|nr:tRNA (adenosine(37)-N6)-threonylcarbamoyltransferase complex ATPase subunit type 1 TsaE [Candidatus Eisenbacteria bacterium]
MQAVVDSGSEEQTLSLGKKIGRSLVRGDVVGIRGELGAGKSVIVRGICEGLGIAQRTRSPSFTFMNRYRGPVDVYHIDLYRIERMGELATLGWEEVLYSDSITLIEWADKFGPLLPPASLDISIEMTGEETRRITLKASAERHERIVEDILTSGNR